jgi:hypothetical protein
MTGCEYLSTFAKVTENKNQKSNKAQKAKESIPIPRIV